MSLLTIVQSVQDRVGLPRAQTVIGGANQSVREILSFANQAGYELMERHEWEELVAEQTFTTTAADAQAGALPSDFHRFLDGSMYNRTTDRKVYGPISAQEWQMRKATVEASTIHDWFRLRGGELLLTPQPAAGETIAYEYVSKNWAQSSGGTNKAAFSADDDVVRFPTEELMVLATRWRWLKAKGMEWQTAYQEAENLIASMFGKHAGAATLKMGGRRSAWLHPNIPEGNWP